MNNLPLAARMRPEQAQELLGQASLWAPGTILWKLAHADRFHSLLFWGPPGTGKTSLARLIGRLVGRDLRELSAVESGVRDIRAVLDESKTNCELGRKSLILFLDEIHRLNKNQQDVLLPAIESGQIKFIGCTSENPSFSVNNAILSRSLSFGFKKLSQQDLKSLLLHIAKKEAFPLAETVADTLAGAADGDARAALNLLELVIEAKLGANEVGELRQLLARHYDKSGEHHYDIISAFIKTIRASDPDAALYYLARMLAGGEDPLFIARRLVIAASEDIGNAHPTALVVAQATLSAVKEIGMPEARIILAQATTYLASSPKSNRSYEGINAALALVKETGALPVPLSLRNAPTHFMRQEGYGAGYLYAHDDPQCAAMQTNLPDAIAHHVFYRPSQQGAEKQMASFLASLRPHRYTDPNKR